MTSEDKPETFGEPSDVAIVASRHTTFEDFRCFCWRSESFKCFWQLPSFFSQHPPGKILHTRPRYGFFRHQVTGEQGSQNHTAMQCWAQISAFRPQDLVHAMMIKSPPKASYIHHLSHRIWFFSHPWQSGILLAIWYNCWLRHIATNR